MFDLERVESLIKTLENTPVEELVLADRGMEVRVRRHPAARFLEAPEEEIPVEVPGPAEHVIVARRVGVYQRPQHVIHPGDRIEAGEVVGFIEAMRIPSEIISEYSGVVVEVFVEDGSPVDYGHELIRLRETPGEKPVG